ncbi:hypothetical protein [Vibrio maerlii]|uniref:hypothetical protein n=1 Tax=Vibrio maerlii TaxID=2231648 RepID=UPI001F146537|nr:hypothetical protein [Vibrio maerlii]
MLTINPIRTGMYAAIIAATLSSPTFAEEEANTTAVDTAAQTEEELQDMSDPLAIFTQAGFGFSDKGINIKYGATYATGKENTAGMQLVEIKGIGGEAVGWSGNNGRDNSIDSIRYRDFQVSFDNGRGRMIDLDYNFDTDSGSGSYNFIQALPKFGPVQLFPLAGLGVSIANNYQYATPEELQTGESDVRDGISVPGVFGAVGMYSVIKATDKLWFNYNPIWMSTIGGSDKYVDYGFAGKGDILLHEAAMSYQINPRLNVRYFANWNEHVDYVDGDHRIEFNYQF